MKTIITSAMVWNVDNVKSFRGYDVDNGEISISDSEFEDILDENYGTVEIMGMTYNIGNVLNSVDPVAFRCTKGDEESSIQTELEDAIQREDESDIQFSEYETSDINEDEEEDE